MGFVADYLNEGSFENRRRQRILHPKALCEMMEALTGDTRFSDLVEELIIKQKKRKDIIMCEYIDMLEARGKEIGESQLASGLEKLYSLGQDEDAKPAVKDKIFRAQMYKEHCIAS